jgi:hypothetical protein
MGVSIYILEAPCKASQPSASESRLPALLSTPRTLGRSGHFQPIHSLPAAIVDFPPTLFISLSVDVSSVHSSAASRSQSRPDPPCCPVCALLADVPCVCCANQFCSRHTYLCPDCHIVFCAGCFDLHLAEGHWSDSDTATALAQSYVPARPAIAKLPHQPAPCSATAGPSTTNQPAPCSAAAGAPTTSLFAAPTSIESLNCARVNASFKAPGTNHHPADCLLDRPIFSSYPGSTFPAIVNFIRLLAHVLLPPRLPFAFSAVNPREAGQ